MPQPAFRCHAIPSETAARFRSDHRDDFGSELKIMSSPDGGLPCRHCLARSRPGEEMLLGSYKLERPKGVYWTPSPIFVHAKPCAPFDGAGRVPEVLHGSLLSLRSYDAQDMVIYDLGVVTDSQGLTGLIERALADTRTSYINVHTARPGCMLCVITRA